MKSCSRSKLTRHLLLTALFCFSASLAFAQSRWSATPVDGEWSNPANWVDGVVPNGNTVSVEFGESTITQIHLNEERIAQKVIIATGTDSYVFSGAKLIVDVNVPLTVDAFVVAGSGAIILKNELEFRNSQTATQYRTIDVRIKDGASLRFEGLETKAITDHLQFTGIGKAALQGDFEGGNKQIFQSGSIELEILNSSIKTQAIRSLANSGKISLFANIDRSLQAGVNSPQIHHGRLYLAKNGIRSTGVFTYVGVGPHNSPVSTNQADLLFGTDIPGQGSVEHTGRVMFEDLTAGNTGGIALYRLHTGEEDTFLISGVIAGTADGYDDPLFRKGGPGTAVFSAVNTYGIPTEVAEGTLLITGSLAETAVSVREGATLGGTGTLAGAVTVEPGAFLAPGSLESATGVLHAASLTLEGSLVAEYDAASVVPMDVVEVAGSLKLNGATLTLSPLSTSPLTELSYVIASYGSLEGTFAAVTGLPNGYVLDYAFGGNHIALVRAVSDAYTQWIDGYPEVVGPDRNLNADPDGDGLSNFHEFAFGSHPAQSTSRNTLTSRHGTIGGVPAYAGVLAFPESTVFTSDGLSLIATANGLTYRIEGSADLAAWGTVQIVEVTDPSDMNTFITGLPAAEPNQWSYRVFVVADDFAGNWFLRARIAKSS